MVTLDRHFVVTEPYVRRATRAAFIAWHHMPRPWRRYGTCAVGGLLVALVLGSSAVTLIVPVAIIADVIVRYRATAQCRRSFRRTDAW
ncbi:MAG: hypothetical protein JWN22_1599 [Nocardioides sp.]|nr:hypothetical protein [Nocardioides sp.]